MVSLGSVLSIWLIVQPIFVASAYVAPTPHFAKNHNRNAWTTGRTSRSRQRVKRVVKTTPVFFATRKTSCLSMAATDNSVHVTNPSSDDAANMGIREWPQQVKSKGTSVETTSGNKSLVRYVLEGKGKLTIVDTTTQSTIQTTNLVPGTLIEISDNANVELLWEITSNDMIILTPTFEEGGKLIGAFAALVALSVALLAGVGQ